ncbi:MULTISPECIES: DUF4870 domain-containing protein [unclassified Motilimonas]|uniref:DUF4870 domain-containing protein n=1 Tax=Motilimonas TaxID=1914248 RepID=UPI001E533327|nr:MULTISPECIES: DUF4870 domain-containing protein [unclassified Motilimonas]MCE0555845.1 DUF4870 domain-containing protein [Motilimonas sp. E26]MDO6524106.1 DUF4870 domain-containing protein [Motilimonas sp. 1_MG-2023]
MSNEISQGVTEISQDSKNMALIGWVATIFFGFIPCLILYLVKTDDAYIKDQAKEALNWSITVAIAYVVAFILSIIVIGALLIPVIAICNLIFCIMGAIAASKGEQFRVPFTLRFLK